MATGRWFHAYATGQQAKELLLKEGQKGSFMVWPSQNKPGDFILSVRHVNEVVHIRIRKTDDYYDLCGGEKFPTLGELVGYYLENPGILRERSGRVVELRNGLNCKKVTTERWYYGNLSGREAETLLLTKGQDGSFLIRNSAHNPGCYVLSVRVNERVSHIIIRNKCGVFFVGGGPMFDDYVLSTRADEHVSDIIIRSVFDGGSLMFDDTRVIYAEIGSGSGFMFDSLTSLVEHYKKNPMMELSGSVIHLTHPFLPANISQRVSGLHDKCFPVGNNVGEASVKEGTEEKVEKGATKPVCLFMQNACQKPPNQLSKQQSLRGRHHFPSYVEVNPNQPIVVQHLPPRHNAQDNDMWAQIKFQMLPMPCLDSPSHRSSSTSDLTSCSSSDYYSNLADFSLGVGSTEEILMSSSSSHQLRRHSFSEGDERLIVRNTAGRDSIISVSALNRQVVLPQGESLRAESHEYSLATSSKLTFTPPTYKNPALNGGVGIEGDYMNQFPEGLLHTYSNEGYLLQQLQAKNLPVPEFTTKTSDDINLPLQQNQSSLQATLRAALLKYLKPARPKLQEIHSATILKEERRRTLASFELPGALHVGQDCADFLRKESAWGEHPQSETDKKQEEKVAEFQAELFQGKESSSEEVKEKIAATKLSTSRTHRKLQASDSVDLTQEKAKVKALMPYWYRPDITRDEAIDFVRKLEEGLFIVRDSQTVTGGYALTMKVSERQVRQRRNLTEGHPVTEDMCVRHFLIKSDMEGVKLHGWNERPFESLPAFIAQHMLEKQCLPCKLVLPKSQRSPATMKGVLINGGDTDVQLERLLEKYRHQRKIKHKSLKCLFTGPPRVGKTTLKKRLLKAIKNLISSGEVSPSGGLEKPITVVIGETRECVTVVMESDVDWQPQHDLLDETQIVLEFIDHQSTTQDRDPSTPVLVPLSAVSATPISRSPFSPTLVPPMEIPPIPDTDTPTLGKAEAEADTLDEAKQLMQEVLASRRLRSFKDIEKTTTLYLIDVGGQPEFHEIMPIILNGPALYMVFFNLAFNLDDSIPIQFCQQDGTDSMITYKSSFTGRQMIYQLLSSNYSFSKGLSPHCESAAVLIGTHLDQLRREGERKIKEINATLKELLDDVEFHNEGFLTYPTKDRSTIFIPVDNYSGEEEEIHQLQAFLRQVINDQFDAVELPSSWLFFHLLLRHRYENSPGVCNLADCRALAKGCGLDENDVPQVLRYIHRHLGTILFYEKVPGLNELVICDPNVLFKSIYQLVAVSFGGDRGYHTITAQIRKTGEIPGDILKCISTQSSSSLLTNEHIIELLKHYKILTELNSGGKMFYFMPCLLQPDNSLQFSCEALQALCLPPLLVRFDGNYIPVGVFSALVVKLSLGSWEPDRDSRYRNHILFYTGGLSSVELIVYPAYLEFRITIANYKGEEPEEIHQFCMEVRLKVVSTLKAILGLHEHTRKTKFQLGFYCPGSFQGDGEPHFCGCLLSQNHINPKSFLCSKSPRCQDECRLPHECTVWFEYWKSKETTRDRRRACEAFNSTGDTSRTADEYAGLGYEPKITDLMNEIAVKLPDKWQDIGRGLGLEEYELKQIQTELGWQQSTNVFFSCVFYKWRIGKKSPYTWEQVLKVLYQPAVGGDRVADELKEKYRVT